MSVEKIAKLYASMSLKERECPMRKLNNVSKDVKAQKMALCLVLAGGPWSFDDALIVLEEPVEKWAVKSVKFNLVEFWIQICNIPIICMMKDINRFLGSIIGGVREMDVEPSGDFLGSITNQDLLYGAWLKANGSSKQQMKRRWSSSYVAWSTLGNWQSYDLVEEAWKFQ
ncbi:hypothetical protein Ddye_026124 [Dipteronia dyeriana]|uniref:DUF4283 domain-containing protein n=1 Tax=Dipteronia dyeriana TaxID=168575 RepID=A0AAD9TMI2_9ROSI|nr:hypothetical protein Ddye_026124 [Dipteronia dyeriana]